MSVPDDVDEADRGGYRLHLILAKALVTDLAGPLASELHPMLEPPNGPSSSAE